MIRHYEATGLIRQVERTFAGYRLYSDQDVHMLRFIKRARSLGFSTDRIEQLVGLWQDHGRASREVKRVALAHAAELDARIREMEAMKRALEELARHCHGNERPECPILDDLARLSDREAAGDRGPMPRNGKAVPAIRRRRPGPDPLLPKKSA
jgi:Cu(I)-responsive transcriptional regulator